MRFKVLYHRKRAAQEVKVHRYYGCGDDPVCQSGWFEDKLFMDAFINDCFGVNQLDQDVVNEFLSLLDSGNKDWQKPLKNLLDILYGLNYWTSNSPMRMTDCAVIPPSLLPTKVMSSKPDEKINKESENSIHKTIGLLKSRYYSSMMYGCPINSSIVWREKLRFCGRDDRLTAMTECKCVNGIGIYNILNFCFDEYGYLEHVCEPKVIECECFTALQESTTSSMVGSASAALTKSFTSRIFPRIKVTTSQATLFFTDVTQTLTIAVIVLCACVTCFLSSIIIYCLWRTFCKSRYHPEVVFTSHLPQTQPVQVNETTFTESNTGNVPDDGYFCVGNTNDNLYHTIGANFRTVVPTSNAIPTTAPPLPARSFSVSTFSSDVVIFRAGTSHLGLQRSHASESDEDCLRPYRSTDGQEEEIHHDEIPIPSWVISLREDTISNEYETENAEDDENEDIRINPLYATSEDED